MKVLDLQCPLGHVFEGWFASEDDFQGQRERGLVQCPMCGDEHIEKRLSAPRLNLGVRAPATQAAANLSQIGRMFVPKDILNKPDVLSNEEKQIMEEHVEHSRRVLQNIEFDLPIVEAIYEMNERLDGTGYPRHLEGDSIGIHARILAVANAFTAMARPRSYRNALSLSQVLDILKEEGQSYDQKVVEALAILLSTSAGERLVNTLSTKDKN